MKTYWMIEVHPETAVLGISEVRWRSGELHWPGECRGRQWLVRGPAQGHRYMAGAWAEVKGLEWRTAAGGFLIPASWDMQGVHDEQSSSERENVSDAQVPSILCHADTTPSPPEAPREAGTGTLQHFFFQ